MRAIVKEHQAMLLVLLIGVCGILALVFHRINHKDRFVIAFADDVIYPETAAQFQVKVLTNTPSVYACSELQPVALVRSRNQEATSLHEDKIIASCNGYVSFLLEAEPLAKLYVLWLDNDGTIVGTHELRGQDIVMSSLVSNQLNVIHGEYKPASAELKEEIVKADARTSALVQEVKYREICAQTDAIRESVMNRAPSGGTGLPPRM